MLSDRQFKSLGIAIAKILGTEIESISYGDEDETVDAGILFKNGYDLQYAPYCYFPFIMGIWNEKRNEMKWESESRSTYALLDALKFKHSKGINDRALPKVKKTVKKTVKKSA